MGRKLFLKAADGHQFAAYRADPAGPPRGRVVVIQEIFGVNRHIRSVCDRLAMAGYVALAPQLFDRVQRDFESGYSDAEVARARELVARVDWERMMLDTRTAVESVRREGPAATMGFCMGGTVSFLSAVRIDGLAAAVCYYGGQIARHADSRPRCPVQMHFGEKDTHIPMSDVTMIRSKRPESEIHVYPGAGHGFHCDERGSYEPASAKIAWERSLGFLSRNFAAARPATPPRPAAAPAPVRPAPPRTPVTGATVARPAPKPAPAAKAAAPAKKPAKKKAAKRKAKTSAKLSKKARRKSKKKKKKALKRAKKGKKGKKKKKR